MRRAGWPPSFVVAGTEPHAEEGGALAPGWLIKGGKPFEPSAAAAPGIESACGSVGTDPAPGCARRVMTSVGLPRLLGEDASTGTQVRGGDVG